MSPRSSRGFEPQDRYFRMAKQQGFRSRAAFKLKEIDQKFRLFRPGQVVLDLGAAPGGWCQVALQAVGPPGRVIGVDREAIQELRAPNLRLIQGDLQEIETQEQLQTELQPVDVLLSDMAPATTGIKFQDHLQSTELARTAVTLAQQSLRTGGHLVIKIFPGEGLSPLKKELKRLFRQVHEFIPEASRQSSKEIYLVATGYQK